MNLERLNPTEAILWLDLETTGSNPEDEVIEIAMAITDTNFFEHAAFSATFRPNVSIFTIDPTVIEMHMQSGLWRDIYNNFPTGAYTDHAALEADMLAWLKDNIMGTQHIPLAGSGVSHFDRQFIKRLWPKFNKRLTYWAYDVGVLRRFIRDHTIVPLDSLQSEHLPQPNHRALQDVRAAIAEYATYSTFMNILYTAANAKVQP